jgi:hypothetical protein
VAWRGPPQTSPTGKRPTGTGRESVGSNGGLMSSSAPASAPPAPAPDPGGVLSVLKTRPSPTAPHSKRTLPGCGY